MAAVWDGGSGGRLALTARGRCGGVKGAAASSPTPNSTPNHPGIGLLPVQLSTTGLSVEEQRVETLSTTSLFGPISFISFHQVAQLTGPVPLCVAVCVYDANESPAAHQQKNRRKLFVGVFAASQLVLFHISLWKGAPRNVKNPRVAPSDAAPDNSSTAETRLHLTVCWWLVVSDPRNQMSKILRDNIYSQKTAATTANVLLKVHSLEATQQF